MEFPDHISGDPSCCFRHSLLCLQLGVTATGRDGPDGPISFTVAGVGVAIAAPADLAAAVNSKGLFHLAEIGLVLLLFTDAGHTDLALLWSGRAWPARLLGIGLPLAIVSGAVTGWMIFPGAFPLGSRGPGGHSGTD
jgi:NhaP-type Na+/H+ or K+/H+ antiporter